MCIADVYGALRPMLRNTVTLMDCEYRKGHARNICTRLIGKVNRIAFYTESDSSTRRWQVLTTDHTVFPATQ